MTEKTKPMHAKVTVERSVLVKAVELLTGSSFSSIETAEASREVGQKLSLALASPLLDREAVAVKALVWEDNYGHPRAETPFFSYGVTTLENGRAEFDGEHYATVGLAKAAAQADYEQRIRSALDERKAEQKE